MEQKIAVVAVTGPTATGKTALGIRLAQHYGGEIVSCDSMQIYRGLSIGSAAPSPEELSAVPHHLIGFCSWETAFSVSDYVNLAGQVIHEIHQRGKKPFLVGGSGLYARSLLRGVSFDQRGRKEETREKLQQEAQAQGIAPLYERLCALDPKAAEKIHPHNEKRVIRALEFCLATGLPFSSQEERSKEAPPKYRYQMLSLGFRDRQKLYERIDLRVDRMIEQGLEAEALRFYQAVGESKRAPTASQAIGYKELFPYFRGEVPFGEAVENIKRESRRYAKRQLTWFQREENACFLFVDELKSEEALFQAAVEEIERCGIFS